MGKLNCNGYYYSHTVIVNILLFTWIIEKAFLSMQGIPLDDNVYTLD